MLPSAGEFDVENCRHRIRCFGKRGPGHDKMIENAGHVGTVPVAPAPVGRTLAGQVTVARYARRVNSTESGPQRSSSFGDLGVGGGAGLTGGLFGVGGGLILVPYLVLVRHWPQKQAQATSLVAVAMSALAGAATYAYFGSVAWLAFPFILVGGLGGAVFGSAVVRRLQPWVLQLVFSAVIVLTAIKVAFTPVSDGSVTVAPDLTVGLALGYLAAGLAMGILSALLGIGGGLVLVPVLVTLFGYTPYLAAGTSLAVMVLIALTGAARQTQPGFTLWSRGVVLGMASAVGAFIGARVALLLPMQVLVLAFAALLIFVATRMFWSGWQGRRAHLALGEVHRDPA